MTQPAFSQQIRSLERRLGLELVDRTTRHVALTAAGRALLPDASATVAAADRLLQAADRQARTVSGQVVIGSLEAVTAVPPVPEIIEELRKLHPDLDIQIHRTGFAGSPDALLKGEVDVSFAFLPVPAGMETLSLISGPRCAAMASDDPLAAEKSLTLDQLADRPCIGWAPQVPRVWQEFWSADPRPDGSRVPHSPHAVSDFESALTVIPLGEGIQFPPTVARELYPRPGVSYVDVTDLEPWTMVLAWLPKNRDMPHVVALRQAAGTVLSRRGEAPA